MPRTLNGLREIAGVYEAILLDQFGVLHDGRRAFPEAPAAVRALKDAGARIAVVSNSGKRAATNRARLQALGFSAELFDGVLSSGELGRQRLQAWLDDGTLPAGAGVSVIASDADHSLIDGLDLREVSDPDATRLLLLAGAAPSTGADPCIARALAGLSSRGVPALCVNPDRWIYANGGVADGPGTLAERYAAMGGDVTWIGKPQPEIFRGARATLDLAESATTLVIGDSPEHDVAGARNAGYPCLFVTRGIYAEAAAPADRHPNANVSSEFVIPTFRW
jgi:HAD superfamily hydrolase (TIGR01459 family)